MLKAKKRLTRKEIKEDKLVTYYFKALDYYEAHKREFLYGAIAVVAIIAFGLYYMNSQKAAEQTASVEFAKGKAAYESGNYDAAIGILEALTSDFDGTHGAATGTIYLAKAYMAKGQYEDAERTFKKYLDDYGDDPILSLAAATGIAASHEARGEHDKAAEAYEKAAKKYKDSFKAPDLLFAAARSYKEAGRPQDAKRVLDQLLETYPESQVASDAKLMLGELRS